MTSDIQELVLGENSYIGVDLLVDSLDTLLHHADMSSPQLFLLDVQNADIDQLRHLILHLKEISRLNQIKGKMNIALLLGPSVLHDVVDALLKTLAQRNNVQHFCNYDKATMWLQLEYARYMRA
jgi:hypothetical protein